MIYRLRFCNKDGIEARVDIQKGLATPVVDVEGTNNPFTLSYNNDKGNKSGMFLSSSADIEIYETADFNIDNLKTSNETELAVTYYINNIVKWQGFIIPDFFSIEVRSNPVIVMTASDRLGTLKNVTLSDLPSMISLRELAILCLNKTGLTLPLKTIADFSNDGTNNAFFSYYVDSQRIKDIKGRSISCYDILSSILIASNSKLVQRAGEWVIINKLQHEIGSGKIYSSLSSFTNYLENIYNFDEVSIGARRTIMPVAGSIGIYHEHGGRKSHPENYDFSLGLSGWNSVNGFVATIENRHIIGFLGGTPLFDADRTVKQYLLNYNNWIDNTNNLNTAPYISTDAITINSPRADRVEVTVDISSTMAEKLSSNTAISFLRYAVILTNGVKTYTLTKAGIFEILDPENISGHSLLLRGGQQPPLLLASPAFSNSDSFKGLFEVGEDDDVNNYSATIRVYGSGDQYVTVNYAIIKFSDASELPKGTMYKTEQGNVFTKAYDIETSIFGDYLLSGLDGYFYRYPNDDTSSIYKDVNTLSSPIWTTPSIPNETGELPLLHHSMRQMRRMFSVAHDLLSAEIEVSDFDPLAIFVACEKRYTVVSAQFDFFKSNLSVELEEVAFQNNVIREYIYSYFGDGESGIKSIGGISGGSGGGTGGGLTPEQLEILSFWKKDPDNPNTIFTEMNAYSMGELSAYGIGLGGSSGGGVDLLQAWTDYDSAKDNWAVKAGLLVPFYNDTRSRLTSLEGGAALSLSPVGSGNGVANITKSGTVLTVTKANFAELDINGKILSSQLPSYVDDVLEYVNLAAFPATGETGKIYIAQDSNKTYRWSGTAYVEISASLALGETSSTAYRGDRGKIAYDHSQTEHQTIINGTGFVKANGKTLSYDNNSYSLASHNHSGVYEPVLGSPSASGYLLSSTNAGVRSWVAPYSLPTASASVLGGVKIGANVSIASGVISVHNPVTIGTANGLSLSTQVLSLALATTAANGALSSTDKAYIDLLKTFFEYDSANNAIKALKSFYSTGEVSAYGIGSGGGGTSYDRLDAWADYDSTKSGWVLSALLGNELNTRVGNLESGSATTVNTTGTGNAITSISKSGTVITASKDLTFSLSDHLHTGVYEPVFSKNTAFNKNFGTVAGTVAQGNDSRINNGQTAFGWGNHASAGYALNSAFNTHNNDNVRHITGAERTKWDGVVTDFENLEIGGRNLLLNSGVPVTNSNYPTKVYNLSPIGQTLVDGEDVTIVIKGSLGAGQSYFRLYNSGGSVYAGANIYSSEFIDGIAIKTFKWNKLTASNTTLYVYPFPNTVTVDSTIEWIKLVRGNKTSRDWTPAPEDQVSDWLTTDVNSFSFIKNKPTLLSQFTDNIGVATHIANTSNPHSVTKAQVGLGSVDNTSDLNKPISTATQTALNLKVNKAGDTLTGNLTAPTFIGALTGNASSSTKLQTARTLTIGNTGKTFDGSTNVSWSAAEMGVLPLSGGTLTGTLTTADVNIAYDKRIGISYSGTNSTLYNYFYGGSVLNLRVGEWTSGEVNVFNIETKGGVKALSITNISGNVGIGNVSPSYKLDVNGTGRFTGALTAAVSVTTPKVIFAAAGWSVEQSGTEIQFKYNGAIKQRLLSDGTIVGIGEITAFGSTT